MEHIKIEEEVEIVQEDGTIMTLEPGDVIQINEQDDDDSAYGLVFQSDDGSDFFDEIKEIVDELGEDDVKEAGKALGAWINALLDDLGDNSGNFEAALKNSMR